MKTLESLYKEKAEQLENVKYEEECNKLIQEIELINKQIDLLLNR